MIIYDFLRRSSFIALVLEFSVLWKGSLILYAITVVDTLVASQSIIQSFSQQALTDRDQPTEIVQSNQTRVSGTPGKK